MKTENYFIATLLVAIAATLFYFTGEVRTRDRQLIETRNLLRSKDSTIYGLMQFKLSAKDNPMGRGNAYTSFREPKLMTESDITDLSLYFQSHTEIKTKWVVIGYTHEFPFPN